MKSLGINLTKYVQDKQKKQKKPFLHVVKETLMERENRYV